MKKFFLLDSLPAMMCGLMIICILLGTGLYMLVDYEAFENNQLVYATVDYIYSVEYEKENPGKTNFLWGSSEKNTEKVHQLIREYHDRKDHKFGLRGLIKLGILVIAFLLAQLLMRYTQKKLLGVSQAIYDEVRILRSVLSQMRQDTVSSSDGEETERKILEVTASLMSIGDDITKLASNPYNKNDEPERPAPM